MMMFGVKTEAERKAEREEHFRLMEKSFADVQAIADPGKRYDALQELSDTFESGFNGVTYGRLPLPWSYKAALGLAAVGFAMGLTPVVATTAFLAATAPVMLLTELAVFGTGMLLSIRGLVWDGPRLVADRAARTEAYAGLLERTQEAQKSLLENAQISELSSSPAAMKRLKEAFNPQYPATAANDEKVNITTPASAKTSALHI